MALHGFFGDGLTGLVGQLEWPADRSRSRDMAQPAHYPQHQDKPDRKASSERSNNDQRAGGPIHYQTSILETRGKAGGDHLEENRRSIAQPQDRRRQQKHDAKPRPAYQQGARKPAGWPGSPRQGVLRGKGKRHL
jgi:hypothetical protein